MVKLKSQRYNLQINKGIDIAEGTYGFKSKNFFLQYLINISYEPEYIACKLELGIMGQEI